MFSVTVSHPLAVVHALAPPVVVDREAAPVALVLAGLVVPAAAVPHPVPTAVVLSSAAPASPGKVLGNWVMHLATDHGWGMMLQVQVLRSSKNR